MPKKTLKESPKKEKVVPMKDTTCGWCNTEVEKAPVPFCSESCKETYAARNA